LVPIVPVMIWWNTPMISIPTSNITIQSETIQISALWWTMLCNAVSYRLVSILE
jgi:hypothetical protein